METTRFNILYCMMVLLDEMYTEDLQELKFYIEEVYFAPKSSDTETRH